MSEVFFFGIKGSEAPVEDMQWLYPLFVDPPQVDNGNFVPRPRPGLRLNPEAIATYRVGM